MHQDNDGIVRNSSINARLSYDAGVSKSPKASVVLLKCWGFPNRKVEGAIQRAFGFMHSPSHALFVPLIPCGNEEEVLVDAARRVMAHVAFTTW